MTQVTRREAVRTLAAGAAVAGAGGRAAPGANAAGPGGVEAGSEATFAVARRSGAKDSAAMSREIGAAVADAIKGPREEAGGIK